MRGKFQRSKRSKRADEDLVRLANWPQKPAEERLPESLKGPVDVERWLNALICTDREFRIATLGTDSMRVPLSSVRLARMRGDAPVWEQIILPWMRSMPEIWPAEATQSVLAARIALHNNHDLAIAALAYTWRNRSREDLYEHLADWHRFQSDDPNARKPFHPGETPRIVADHIWEALFETGDIE